MTRNYTYRSRKRRMVQLELYAEAPRALEPAKSQHPGQVRRQRNKKLQRERERIRSASPRVHLGSCPVCGGPAFVDRADLPRLQCTCSKCSWHFSV